MAFIRKVKAGKRVYLAEVKSVRKNGKVKQEFIKYLGREIDGKPVKKVNTNNIEAVSVKQSLDILAINKVAEELKINDIPNKYFLSLIYSQLLEKRSISKLQDWMRFTEIPELLGLDNISAKRFYESLTEINEEDLEKINEQIFQIFSKYENISEVAIIDVTDTYFAGTNYNIKKRKGKDNQVSKLIQIGLAVSFNNGFPIFYKQYHGNLSGVSIFKDMAIELKDKGIASIIMDRGMLSKENIQIALKLNFKIIAGLKKSKDLVSNFILTIKREEIYNAKHRLKLKHTTVFIKEFDYLQGKLIVVYNPAIELIKKEINFEKELGDKLDIGYSLIYHNTGQSSELVVEKYYDKEMVERAFKHIKGILHVRPIRVWLLNHVEGHIKICYLAYAILSLMNYKLKNINISAVSALESLKTGYKINLRDTKNKNEWSIHVHLEPKQKVILENLGVVIKN